MKSEEKIQSNLTAIREAKNYSNRLLDTMVFTVCGFGIFFTTNMKQWLVAEGEDTKYMNFGIGLSTFLFMSVISLNVYGQRLSKTVMNTDEDYHLELLKYYENQEEYDESRAKKLDKNADQLNDRIRTVNGFIYPILFIAMGIALLLFILV